MTTDAQALARRFKRMGVELTVSNSCKGCMALGGLDALHCCHFGYAVEGPDAEGVYTPQEGVVLCPNPVTEAQYEMRRHEASATVPLVEELAKDLYAALKAPYDRQFAPVYLDGPGPMKQFTPWDGLPERAREAMRIQARALLATYRMFPK